MGFKKLEIDVKGCQSDEQFYMLAKFMAKGLVEQCGCAFGNDEQPHGCCESGDYCEECFSDNITIESSDRNLKFDERDDLQ